MKIDVLTLFPVMLEQPLQQSILGKARQSGKVSITVHDLRVHTHDRHKTADDTPYGGGAGMVMKPEPIFRALDEIKRDNSTLIYLSPEGELFHQKIAEELATLPHLIFLCGHYEGIDERVRTVIHRELSLGDYICSGGEFPVLVIIDVISRLIPGVVGNEQSVLQESFSSGILDYPSYTRPRLYRGLKVPEVLLSGNHALITRWRRKEALKRTVLKKPELLERITLTADDQVLLEEIERELKENSNQRK